MNSLPTTHFWLMGQRPRYQPQYRVWIHIINNPSSSILPISPHIPAQRVQIANHGIELKRFPLLFQARTDDFKTRDSKSRPRGTVSVFRIVILRTQIYDKRRLQLPIPSRSSCSDVVGLLAGPCQAIAVSASLVLASARESKLTFRSSPLVLPSLLD